MTIKCTRREQQEDNFKVFVVKIWWEFMGWNWYHQKRISNECLNIVCELESFIMWMRWKDHTMAAHFVTAIAIITVYDISKHYQSSRPMSTTNWITTIWNNNLNEWLQSQNSWANWLNCFSSCDFLIFGHIKLEYKIDIDGGKYSGNFTTAD